MKKNNIFRFRLILAISFLILIVLSIVSNSVISYVKNHNELMSHTVENQWRSYITQRINHYSNSILYHIYNNDINVYDPDELANIITSNVGNLNNRHIKHIRIVNLGHVLIDPVPDNHYEFVDLHPSLNIIPYDEIISHMERLNTHDVLTNSDVIESINEVAYELHHIYDLPMVDIVNLITHIYFTYNKIILDEVFEYMVSTTADIDEKFNNIVNENIKYTYHDNKIYSEDNVFWLEWLYVPSHDRGFHRERNVVGEDNVDFKNILILVAIDGTAIMEPFQKLSITPTFVVFFYTTTAMSILFIIYLITRLFRKTIEGDSEESEVTNGDSNPNDPDYDNNSNELIRRFFNSTK